MYDVSPDTDKQRLFAEKPQEKEQKFTFSKVLCILSDAILLYSLIISTISIWNYFEVLRTFEGQVIPDLTFLGYLLPSAFVFAGLTHTFYYNKERFANCIKIRFEYIKQLLMFKLNSGLYSEQSLIDSLDSVIEQAESEADALISEDVHTSESQIDNISV